MQHSFSMSTATQADLSPSTVQEAVSEQLSHETHDIVTPDNGVKNLSDVVENIGGALKKTGWYLTQAGKRKAQIKALKAIEEGQYSTFFEKNMAKIVRGALENAPTILQGRKRDKQQAIEKILDQDVGDDAHPTGFTIRDALKTIDEYGPAAVIVSRVVVGMALGASAGGAVATALALGSVGIGLRHVPGQIYDLFRNDGRSVSQKFSALAANVKETISGHLLTILPALGAAGITKLVLYRGIQETLDHASDGKKLENFADVKGTVDRLQADTHAFFQQSPQEILKDIASVALDEVDKSGRAVISTLISGLGSTGSFLADFAIEQFDGRGFPARATNWAARQARLALGLSAKT